MNLIRDPNPPLWAGACLLVLVGGCSDSVGQLAQTPIDRQCGPDDTACQELVVFAPIAAGAELPVSLLPQEVSGSTGVSLVYESARPEVATLRAGILSTDQPGVTAILARIPDGPVIDFMHVWVEPAERLAIHRVTAAGGEDDRELDDSLQLLSGADVPFRMRLWGPGRELIGNAKETWTFESAADFQLFDEGYPGERTLLLPPDDQLPAEGVLTVEALDLTRTILVEVIR